ncbi:MAG TPA: NAD(P)-dependent oxidoreductase [Candidatus Acidoferrales bacterium]|nr:NAD(P)-dependent oxidoreductase [Candidatus Acidoferrales bacterium]
MQQQIALIGLGTMGIGMGGRLLQAGFPLKVYNRTPQRASELVAKGAVLASSPADAAANADVIIAIVSDDAASREVWLGDKGGLSTAKPGAVVIDSSTISPRWAREFAEAARKKGCAPLDAPVTGSKPQAASGELLFLVGGDAEALEKARPALAAMSRKIVYMGPNGSGALMKLINNFLAAVQTASLGEAIALIERSGMNRDTALDILYNGAPGSPLIKIVGNRMTSRDYSVNFFLHLMKKDLTYAAAEAGEHGLQWKTAAAAISLFEEAQKRGWGEKDFSSVVEAAR